MRSITHTLSVLATGLATLCNTSCTCVAAASGATACVDYYVPKDVLLVVGTRTLTRTAELSRAEGGVRVDRSETRDTDAAVSLRTVADSAVGYKDANAGGYQLCLPAKASADTSLTVVLRDNRVLQSVNTTSVGRGGDILTAIGKIAGVVAAALLLLGFDQGHEIIAVSECAPAKSDWPTLSPETQLLLSDPKSCSAWAEKALAVAAVQKLTKTLRKLEEDIAAQGPGPALTALQKKRSDLLADAAREQALAETQAAFLSTALAGVRKRHKLDDERIVTPFKLEMALKAITRHGAVPSLLTTTEVPYDTAVSELARADPGAPNLEQLGFLVTLEGQPRLGDLPSKPPASSFSVVYRPTQPFVLRGYSRKACSTNPKVACLSLAYESTVDLQHPDSPPLMLQLDARSFSEGRMSLTFDDRGRPTKFELASTSSAAGAANAIAGGLTAFRDEYLTSLTKLTSIEEQKRKLQLDKYEDQLAELQKKKAVLDARLDLDAATAGFADSLERKRLDSDLASLQAQVALKAAEATAEQKVELERLKADLGLLQAEVDRLKALAQISDLKKPQ